MQRAREVPTTSQGDWFGATSKAHQQFWVWSIPSRRLRAWIWVYVTAVGLVVVALSVTSGLTSSREDVLNPSAATNLSYWSASSDAGEMSLSRVTVQHGPGGVSTAVEVRREGGEGNWAFALCGLRRPEAFISRGQTYRMRVYVRDVNASGRSVGLVLASGNFDHRPTDESQWSGYTDDAWHVLERTFVATADAGSDTELYLSLPPDGPLRFQFTRASVTRVLSTTPPAAPSDKPSTVLSFDGPAGTSPDHRFWSHEVGGNGWGSDELQTYTASTANSELNGHGVLVLTARRQDATGPDGIRRHYTSARVTTAGRLEVQPGSYVEASIRAATGEGIRPAFWLAGADVDQVGWPACGELDVMEATQESAAMVRQSIHVSRLSDPDQDAPYGEHARGGFTPLAEPRDASTHLYGVYFDDNLVQFYVDRKPTLSLTRQEALERDRAWPFGKPQSVILSLAVGDDRGTTHFPVHMEVSKVEVWRGGVPPPPPTVLPRTPSPSSPPR
jgi:beta-glucanase (GH16 family)